LTSNIRNVETLPSFHSESSTGISTIFFINEKTWTDTYRYLRVELSSLARLLLSQKDAAEKVA
jgi:hypothetical protein